MKRLKKFTTLETGSEKLPVFFRYSDVLIVAGLLAAAIALWIVFLPKDDGTVAEVQITHGEGRLLVVPLSEDGVHHIEGAALPVQLEVEDGSIRFIHSVCPDHDCEAFGWLRRDGEWAACLPAGVTVTVVEK